MEYHKIGERFEYDGVMLEVIGLTGCASCFFNEYGECKLKDDPKYCGIDTRNDKRSISYRLVEQLKQKDMEQKNEEPQSKNNSIKNDRLDDKLHWELLPLEDVEDIVRVYTAGAKKYGENKWQDLPDGIRRYKAALLRHLVEFDKGNEIDKETGCLHLAQCAWNAIAMLHISKQQKKNGNQN